MTQQPSMQPTMLGRLGAIWGVAGVSLLLSFAVYRLMANTINSFSLSFIGITG